MDSKGMVVKQQRVGCWWILAWLVAALAVVARRRARIGPKTQKDIEALFGPD